MIVNRYIEQCSWDADVFVIRDDMKFHIRNYARGRAQCYNETDDLPLIYVPASAASGSVLKLPAVNPVGYCEYDKFARASI